MKKILATLLCAVMLISCLVVTSFARDTEINFSVNTVEGQPGDTVDVEVYLDKNPGTWAAKFNVCFDGRYFTLLSVDNGDVFTDGEFGKSLLTNDGFYTYYAQGDNFDENNSNTGLILTLTFEITSAAPNGSHSITLEFPDNGAGWFIDATEAPDFDTEFDVSCTKNGAIIVTGSDATESPETTPDGEIDETPNTKPAPGKPVTEVVTNGIGEDVTNDDGSVMTQQSTDTAGNPIYYETDKEGSVVTGDNGEEITFADTTKAPEQNGNGSEDESKGTPAQKIILICAIAAVVIGAIVVIIVVTKSEKKKDSNKDDVKEDNDDSSEE